MAVSLDFKSADKNIMATQAKLRVKEPTVYGCEWGETHTCFHVSQIAFAPIARAATRQIRQQSNKCLPFLMHKKSYFSQ